MLVPYWLGSVWIERRAILKRRPDIDARRLSKAVLIGNLASYAIFFVFGVVGLCRALEDLPNKRAHSEARRLEIEDLRKQVDERR